jgi:hypothetical protein
MGSLHNDLAKAQKDAASASKTVVQLEMDVACNKEEMQRLHLALQQAQDQLAVLQANVSNNIYVTYVPLTNTFMSSTHENFYLSNPIYNGIVSDGHLF